MERTEERLQADEERLGLGLRHAEQHRREYLLRLAVEGVQRRLSLSGKAQHHAATIDLDAVRRYREQWLMFRDRRPELYGRLATLDGIPPSTRLS